MVDEFRKELVYAFFQRVIAEVAAQRPGLDVTQLEDAFYDRFDSDTQGDAALKAALHEYVARAVEQAEYNQASTPHLHLPLPLDTAEVLR